MQASYSSRTGRRKPVFRIGVNRHSFSGFFVPVNFARFIRVFRYGVVIWAALRLAAPIRGISYPI
jgi:hypothetical protein